MYKKVIGFGVLIVLIALMITNYIDQQKVEEEESNLYDVTGDTGAQGAMISSGDTTGIEVGETAPNIELETVDGETFSLTDLRGKKVILNFWATWCPPCREEMPEMQKFYDEHKDEVEVVAVNLSDTENNLQDVPDYISQYGYTYPIPMDKEGTVASAYSVITVPTTYFIGTDGVVQQARKLGPMDYEFMEEMVEALN
ncbi:TlpA family protein disulfide reductase [Oceanobacillus piezotolerans]|uniref:TlpA family protein disulfide reductase n=1 Tax=Oceanobacillus piezotolerans TaxID=2448030 RepID=A0A498DBL3_9BACI|nr:TlpA disulfide reductase family protein [Oceanobacillus piezotolerans]RLL45420.1 TlpA family protein disulfide reductase [Oceanobacillus piezotolerans]